jgi:hypothetical protein
MIHRSPPRKVTYFDPLRPRLARKTISIPPDLARNTIIESTFDVGRRFRCTMRIDCGEIAPGAVLRPVLGKWRPHPRAPRRRGACRLACRAQCSLPARRANGRSAPRGRRRIARRLGLLETRSLVPARCGNGFFGNSSLPCTSCCEGIDGPQGLSGAEPKRRSGRGAVAATPWADRKPRKGVSFSWYD